MKSQKLSELILLLYFEKKRAQQQQKKSSQCLRVSGCKLFYQVEQEKVGQEGALMQLRNFWFLFSLTLILFLQSRQLFSVKNCQFYYCQFYSVKRQLRGGRGSKIAYLETTQFIDGPLHVFFKIFFKIGRPRARKGKLKNSKK